MSTPSAIYRPSLALLTDLYQLTMAYGFWKAGIGDNEATFNLFFRKNPFAGGYTIACGLTDATDYLDGYHLDGDDLAYLEGLLGNDDKPLFEAAFLDYLAAMNFSCDIEAVPEGTAVFPFEPLLRVKGPLIQCQLLETPLLNMINFQTLIATKAARVCSAARGEPVMEFGLRRAQGIDGALAASRAAHIGGCSGTSNVLAGRLFGIPVLGTHAHSWVMCFDDETEAFRAYARAAPNNCVFLVDTYDTLEGVRNASVVGAELRAEGHEMIGVRLDSGDLAYLSIEARKILDEAGFPDAHIVASNDLDEHLIRSLKDQGATIDTWGVGTKLVTAYDQPALGGVYKLAAIKNPEGQWEHRIKLSEQAIKVSNPGLLQVRRYEHHGELRGDIIWDELTGLPDDPTMVDPMDSTRRKTLRGDHAYDLLVPIFRGGERCYDAPSITAIRQRVSDQLAMLHGGIKRFLNPHQYPVGLELSLYDLKTELIFAAREKLRRAEDARHEAQKADSTSKVEAKSDA
ncbi:MAG: nicotinate phosphoribosyltransferase [Deltaproteobacteria bacterium]|nr:nicotinate phosphoribosyltransferase [Deltaproteobacteria bacterium]